MATTIGMSASERVVRNICTYLGFDGELPLGEAEITDRSTRGGWRVDVEGRAGTLAHALATAIRPLSGELRGAGTPDARLGRQGAIESLLRSWPGLPSYDHEWHTTLGGREWLQQGKDWEYVDIDGRAVFDALTSGESPESIRRRIRSADPTIVSDHRAARNGDKSRPASV